MIVDAVCRVCGASGGSEFSTADAHYLRCDACGTIQKQMSAQQYRDMEPGYDPGGFLEGQSIAGIHDFLKVPMRKALLTEMLDGAGCDAAGLRFLDVGCGMGGYMLAAQQLGMTALGFEPSADHGRLAKSVLGLDVVADYFSSDKVSGQTFDVVLLSHVIEHIYDPKPFVADLLSVLNPGGILIMITPNANSLSAKITGKHWPMFVPIDHVTMMTRNSFAHLVPPGCRLTISTSEYPSEFFATLGSVAKTVVKGRPVNDGDMVHRAAPKLMAEPSARSRIVRGMLAVASLPFHAVARLTDEAAALRAVVVKPG